ncbi:MAG: DUF6677 family protein [Acidobacteriota bacterium]
MTAAGAGRSTNPWIAVLLAWIFPGLGHAYLGRRRTAVVYALVVTLTFVLGMSFQGRLYTIEPGQPLSILATFAVFGAGLLNIAGRVLSETPGGNVLAVTYEYGCAYLLTAGLMNLLLMLDAYDLAVGRKA